MRTFWLFRSNLKHLEYYHKYDTLAEFEAKCHDFYMLFPIWLLRNNFFDTVVVWRLSNNPLPDIDFNVEGKMYSQRWVRNFSEVFNHPKPDMSFFRGGFKEYDTVTKQKPDHFGLKLYLATGRRIYPQWEGNYDVFLQEDKRDFRTTHNCLPFYKTASPQIFRPLKEKIKYDICWPCNFTQLRYKGQEFFIQTISKSKDLQNLSIIHCGNKPGVGKKLCENYGVTNIEFMGEVNRSVLNRILNQSKFGLCLSNLQDGCPRVISEVLMSGTPLFMSNLTRSLPYYKKGGVVEVSQKNISGKIRMGMNNYKKYKEESEDVIQGELSFDSICRKNVILWLDREFKKEKGRWNP
jgi:hypothetical protein